MCNSRQSFWTGKTSRKYDVSLTFIRATTNGKPAAQHVYTSIAYSQRNKQKITCGLRVDAEEVATFKYFVMWDTFYNSGKEEEKARKACEGELWWKEIHMYYVSLRQHKLFFCIVYNFTTMASAKIEMQKIHISLSLSLSLRND